MKTLSIKPQVPSPKKQPAWAVHLGFWAWNLKLGTLFPLGLGLVLFFSCSSNEATITDNSNIKANSVSEQTPADNFTLYEKLLEDDPLNIETRTKLATDYYAAKDYRKAAQHFLLLYGIDKKNTAALIGLGNIYYDTQRNEKAIEFYEKYISTDNKNINVRCDLATCYFRINNNEKAIKILKENIKMDYNHAQSHHNLFIIYKQLGSNQEADDEMKIYNQITAAPKNPGF